MKHTLSILLLLLAVISLCAVERNTKYYHSLVQLLKVDDLGTQEKVLKKELLSLDLAAPINDVSVATEKKDFRFRSI
ncbi:MAG: hypothetical protein AAGH40_14550, partial [Verrucomicrobiota bacterium]